MNNIYAGGFFQVGFNGSKTISTTAGSATVTTTSTAGLIVGQSVSGTRLPAGSRIASITNGTTFVLESGTGVTAGTNVSHTFTGIRGTAKWNGTTWSAQGTAGISASTVVNALALDSTSAGCTTAGSPCIYAGGNFTTAGGTSANRLAKWDGTSWSAVGTGVNSTVNALAYDGSTPQKLYIGGSFTDFNGTNVLNIATWDGTTSSSLSSVGLNGGINALASDASGNIYAGGDFPNTGGVADTSYIAKWNGTSWSALGTGMNGSVTALLYDSTNSVLYAGGSFTTAGGVSANYIAKWDGASWSAVGGGFDNTVRALALDSSGNLYAGGDFLCAAGSTNTGTDDSGTNTCAGSGGTTVFNHIAKWNGTSWSNMATGGLPGMDDAVYAIAVDSALNVYAGGRFNVRVGNCACSYLVKWTPGTSTWSDFTDGGAGITSDTKTLTQDASGNIYAGGSYFLKKWNGSSWADFGSSDGWVTSLLMSGANLYAAGGFTTIGGVSATRLAKWDGTAWSAVTTGTDGAVNAMAFDSSGNLYAGGSFSSTTEGLIRPFIAKWMTAFSKWF
jgi:hypothetical protein